MEKEIGRFGKNSFESVRVCLTSYNDMDLIEIRIWVQDKDDNWVRTKKGLCVSTDLIGELKDLILKAEQELLHEGASLDTEGASKNLFSAAAEE